MVMVMHDTFKRLLEAAMEASPQITDQASLARAINETDQTITNWKSRGVAKGKIAILAARFNVEALWLSEGKGPRSKGMPAPHAMAIDLSEHPDLEPVKRVNFKLHAGVQGYALEVDNGDAAPVFFRKDWMKANGYRPEKLVAFRVAGQSMEPSLWAGDLVVVNLADTAPHDGEVFAVSYEGEPGIKRLRRDAGEWWLTSDNNDQRKFAPKRCTEEVQILGRVIYKQSERI